MKESATHENIVTPENETQDDIDQSITYQVQQEQGLFCCPNDGCIKSYIRHKSLEDHLTIGECSFKPRNEPQLDQVKRLYAHKAEHALSTSTYSLQPNTLLQVSQSVTKGWALKSRKPHVTFTETQKQYLNEKFQVGQVTGRKEDPVSVSNEMRTVCDKNGVRRFKRAEFLTSAQIASYFSRFSRKVNSSEQAAVDETNAQELRNDISRKIQM